MGCTSCSAWWKRRQHKTSKITKTKQGKVITEEAKELIRKRGEMIKEGKWEEVDMQTKEIKKQIRNDRRIH